MSRDRDDRVPEPMTPGGDPPQRWLGAEDGKAEVAGVSLAMQLTLELIGLSHEAAESPLAMLDTIRRAALLIASGELERDEQRALATQIARAALIQRELLRTRGRHLADAPAPAALPSPVLSGSPDAGERARLAELTTREREVLLALAHGEEVRGIAQRLRRSPKTVNNHRYRLMRKLGVANSAQLVRLAIRQGLLNP